VDRFYFQQRCCRLQIASLEVWIRGKLKKFRYANIRVGDLLKTYLPSPKNDELLHFCAIDEANRKAATDVNVDMAKEMLMSI
jgi:hypothetical protein